ncbi:MAG TPA: DoxX family protein, partial [Cytophagaceae bacterium]|nr:DoxX family protein [Cytophagaceae bacterium]
MDIKTTLFWALLLAFILPTYYFGYTKLVGKKNKTESFTRWNYPIWFMKLLGLAEIIAGICLLFSSTKYFGMILLAIVLAGAIVTHLRKDAAKEVLPPLFVGV